MCHISKRTHPIDDVQSAQQIYFSGPFKVDILSGPFGGAACSSPAWSGDKCTPETPCRSGRLQRGGGGGLWHMTCNMHHTLLKSFFDITVHNPKNKIMITLIASQTCWPNDAVSWRVYLPLILPAPGDWCWRIGATNATPSCTDKFAQSTWHNPAGGLKLYLVAKLSGPCN